LSDWLSGCSGTIIRETNGSRWWWKIFNTSGTDVGR
jgi:hypothetical protein